MWNTPLLYAFPFPLTVAAPGGWRGENASSPQKKLSCPPSFEWNKEKMGIFLYKVVKTDDFRASCPSEVVKNDDFLSLAPICPPHFDAGAATALCLRRPFDQLTGSSIKVCTNYSLLSQPIWKPLQIKHQLQVTTLIKSKLSNTMSCLSRMKLAVEQWALFTRRCSTNIRWLSRNYNQTSEL